MTDEPDRMERGIRFGCGAMIGFGMGIYLVIRWLDLGCYVSAALPVVLALLVGWSARKWGDGVWDRLMDVRWWRWWF